MKFERLDFNPLLLKQKRQLCKLFFTLLDLKRSVLQRKENGRNEGKEDNRRDERKFCFSMFSVKPSVRKRYYAGCTYSCFLTSSFHLLKKVE